MKSYREQFEEIWPVPEQIEWDAEFGMYLGDHELRLEWDARLDTFTRCQDTTDVYVSLADELVNELDEIAGWVEAGRADGDDVIRATRLTDRAKQILGRE